MKLEEIVEKYGPEVSKLSRRMICDPELAKDAAQEVWL